MPIINESWKRLWNAQEIRIMVLASLCFQFGLVFLSPLRKRTGQKLLIFLLWSFYLLADYVAILALGNLLKRQYESSCGCDGGVGLGAFWAPFLLLHLGGPDTITSFSIEDNELWLRHFLALVVQVVVAFLVLLELVAIPRLRVAAALVFIAGLVKYSERTWALRSASMDQLRSSMFKSGTDYVILKEHVQGSDEKRSAILEAYDLFKRTMPVVADFRLTSRELNQTQINFRHWDACLAFELVDIELSFLYDVLHTKAILINGWRGFLWRFVTVGMIFSAFVLFIKSEKGGYAKADIIISYVLLGSALFMELISILLIIFSDWMIAVVEQKTNNLLKDMASFIMAKIISCFSPERKHRWSNSMGQYSLLSFSLRDKNTIIRRILVAVKLKTLWDKFIFVHSAHVPSELEDILQGQLRPMGFQQLKDVKRVNTLELEECNYLRWSIKVEFDETILLWHIATDLCFHIHGRNDNSSSDSNQQIISLIISNYMVYLLIMQPSMMPDGIGKIRFQDTCAAVKKFYHVNRSWLTEKQVRELLLDLRIVDVDDGSSENRTWSVLSNACRLAKELNQLEENRRWRVIRGVWVDMLGHAAINCKTYYHAKQLSQGGEFLTHVYQLLAHMLSYEVI